MTDGPQYFADLVDEIDQKAQDALGEIVDKANWVADKLDGAACTEGGQCQSGFCVGQVCCADACGPTCQNGEARPAGTCPGGTCQPGSPVACDPYKCAGDHCATSCGDDDGCVAGSFCNGGGQCVAPEANGQACGRNRQCQSGNCAGSSGGGGGVCCDPGQAQFPAGTCCTPRPAGAPGSPGACA